MTNVIISIFGALGIGSLLGVLLTAWLTDRRERAKRQLEFRTRQLDEFYGPLLALRMEIRARSELRVKVAHAVDSAHAKAMISADAGEVEAASDLHLPDVLKTVDDEHRTFREVLMPRYREMVEVFRGKLWLAEPATRQHFPLLVEFVEVWDKILDDRLPRSVAPAINHSEQNLAPFYSHLEATTDQLRAELS